MITVLYKDGLLDRYVTRDVSDPGPFTPRVEYFDRSRAVWDAAHLNGECGRAKNGCPMCIAKKEAKGDTA